MDIVRNCIVIKSWISVCVSVAVAGSSVSAQVTDPVSVGLGGTPSNGPSSRASISANDRYVVFESVATNLVTGDANGARDIFVRDRLTATTTRVSVGPAGVESDGDSFFPSISSDGRYVAFESLATNLVAGDTNGVSDAFWHDRQTGTTVRVSVTAAGAEADGASTHPAISGDGSIVAFDSVATNLVAGDTNGVMDVFARDGLTSMLSTTTRMSVDSAGVQSNGASAKAAISANGAIVVFESAASNLVGGDSNALLDVFWRDRSPAATGTGRVSVGTGGIQGAGPSSAPSISANGRFVAFASDASNIVAGDSNFTMDVFVRDRQTASTARVSVDTGGSQGAMWSGNPSITIDGRFVTFASDSDNLVGGDSNLTMDVFVRDLLLGTTERASVDSGGSQGALWSGDPSISADGRHVAFVSDSANLVPGDTNGFSDVFVRDSGAASAFESFCFGDGTGAACPCGNSGISGRGCENSGSTGGALLSVTGVASLSADTVQFTSSGEKVTAVSIFLQGSLVIAPIDYGDGLRCTGGNLKRLYTKAAVGGVVVAPQMGDPSISARSAQLNAPIPLGATRPYQVYYRDGAQGFCPDPPGSTFNVSNGFLVAWGG
ncbi:MAG: TolB family protein [Planctomycetota bacterium]